MNTSHLLGERLVALFLLAVLLLNPPLLLIFQLIQLSRAGSHTLFVSVRRLGLAYQSAGNCRGIHSSRYR